MSYQFFNTCNSVDEAKIQYINLVKEYHPDKNPDLSQVECNNITAKINIEYVKLLEDLEKIKEPPEPQKNDPHKSPVSDFLPAQKGKAKQVQKKKKTITRKQVKRGVDIFFDGLEWLNDLKR